MISVYGSSGFIGSNFCRLYEDKVVKIPRDQKDPESDDVLYFISTTDNYNVHSGPYIDINTNLTLLIQTLEKCKKENLTFNFISSWFVYGNVLLNNGIEPLDENSRCNPKGFYSITKRAAEDLLISYCTTFNIKYRILRMCNVYGKEASYSKKKNALQYLIEELKNDRPIELYHDGHFMRDFIHIDDACKAIKTVIDKGAENEIYNISNNEPVVFRDAINHMIKKFDSKSEITNIDPPDFHKNVQVKDMYLNSQKLFDLRYTPRYNIYSGLDEIYG